jgi:hypothetical protein
MFKILKVFCMVFLLPLFLWLLYLVVIFLLTSNIKAIQDRSLVYESYFNCGLCIPLYAILWFCTKSRFYLFISAFLVFLFLFVAEEIFALGYSLMDRPSFHFGLNTVRNLISIDALSISAFFTMVVMIIYWHARRTGIIK